jgi:hypothetical protein
MLVEFHDVRQWEQTSPVGCPFIAIAGGPTSFVGITVVGLAICALFVRPVLTAELCIGSRRFRRTECSAAVVVDDAPSPNLRVLTCGALASTRVEQGIDRREW